MHFPWNLHLPRRNPCCRRHISASTVPIQLGKHPPYYQKATALSVSLLRPPGAFHLLPMMLWESTVNPPYPCTLISDMKGSARAGLRWFYRSQGNRRRENESEGGRRARGLIMTNSTSSLPAEGFGPRGPSALPEGVRGPWVITQISGWFTGPKHVRGPVMTRGVAAVFVKQI